MRHKVDMTAPVASQFNIEAVIHGLCCDLESLRAGTISVPDALARATLGKQICNAVRLQMTGEAFLASKAKPVAALTHVQNEERDA